MTSQAYRGTFLGEEAICLKYGAYEAKVLPGIGANLISYRDVDNNYIFLREPETIDEFRANPGVYGIPVLFPPNRYEDGKMTFNGKTYQFPVNEKSTNNHLHGFLMDIPWTVDLVSADELESRVVLSVRVEEGHPVYQYLPHRFTVRLRYTLDRNGLQQTVTVQNEGTDEMPCLLAFHTAINAPFAPNSKPEDCTFQLTIGNRWELNDRMLPTGRIQELSPDEERMKLGGSSPQGASPYFEEMDNHYSSEPQDGRNRMELFDAHEKVKLVYDVGTAYKHWMVWNGFQSNKFICTEPHTNLVNAPNVDLPAETTGMIGLKPGEIFEETSRIYIIRS